MINNLSAPTPTKASSLQVKIDQNNFKKLAKAYREVLQKKIKHNMKISGKQEEKENLQQLKKSMQTGQDVKVSVISFLSKVSHYDLF
jgi:HKD family nuclease